MTKEIELKFLCNRFVSHMIVKDGTKLCQGYLHVDKDQQIRVRIVDDNRAFICIKHMIGDGIERNEFEYHIPYDDGLILYDKCKFKFEKTRYINKTQEGYHIDIDKYEDGTVVAEVELPTRDTLFTKPMYFEDDVTGIYKYSNYNFAGIPEYINSGVPENIY